MATAMTREVLRAARECARDAGCQLRDLRGRTLRSLFEAAEADGARVYWGLWGDIELDTVIGRVV